VFGRGGVWWGELDRPFVIGHASKNSFSKEPQMAFAPPPNAANPKAYAHAPSSCVVGNEPGGSGELFGDTARGVLKVRVWVFRHDGRPRSGEKSARLNSHAFCGNSHAFFKETQLRALFLLVHQIHHELTKASLLVSFPFDPTPVRRKLRRRQPRHRHRAHRERVRNNNQVRAFPIYHIPLTECPYKTDFSFYNLRPDTNAKRYRVWFHFAVTNW